MIDIIPAPISEMSTVLVIRCRKRPGKFNPNGICSLIRKRKSKIKYYGP